jgi:integrase
MFSDARRAGLIERNPFLGLGLSTGPGRKNIEVLRVGQVFELADIAAATWSSDGYGLVWRAVVLWQAFVGTRPAEAYGLVRADLDVGEAEVDVRRQRTPFTPRDATPDELPLPKNGKTRRIVIPPPALEAIQALPRPIDPNAPLFATRRGRPLSGQVQHYYWHPIRCAFGNASLDLYELRHFCASYMLNDLDLHAEDVAAQLGHTDGGVLVQRLYGHPSTELARKRAHEAHRRPIVVPLRAAKDLSNG